MDDDRLLRTGTPRERELLAAGFDEAPSEEAVRAASIALGLVPNGTATSSEVDRFRRFSGPRWMKLVVSVVASTAVVGLLVGQERVLSRSSPPPSFRAVGLTAPVGSSVDSAASAQADLPFASDPEAPSTGTAGHPTAAAEAVKRKVDTFGAQVTIIDRARAAALAGDPVAALQAVDEYDRRFPGGLLAEEALLLRIEAVVAREGRDAASSLAKRFLAEYPRSVHADRLRLLLTRGSR
jgi:hypothetical protein